MLNARNTRRPRLPIATAALIAVNLSVYAYTASLGEPNVASFAGLWGVVPRSFYEYAAGSNRQLGLLVTPLTSMYLHVQLIHLASNMLYLWVFGSSVERDLGRLRYLTAYTGCGLAAAVAQVLAQPESPLPAVGASGAIAGILAAYTVLRPGAIFGAVWPGLFIRRSADLPAVLMLGLWLLSLLLSGLLSLASGPSNEDAWQAHLGGFFSGLLLMIVFRERGGRAYH
jgi:membrane associated rhomboid family serine protease